MKQAKFLMVALTILMGAMVTSCMNGEEDPIARGMSFMQVKSGDGIFYKYVFKAGEKLTFTATNTIQNFEAKEGDMAIVSWQYDTTLQEVTQNTDNIDVEVLGAQNITCDFAVAETEGEYPDVVSNASVMTLNPDKLIPDFYDKTTLIIPVGYKAEADATKHEFTLVYIQEKETEASDNNVLKFYLRHVTTEDKSKEVKNALSYCAFDFSEALGIFKNNNGGANPTKIVIVAKENFSSNKLEDAKDQEYSVDYKFKD